MNLHHAIRWGAVISITLAAFSANAANRLEGEWRVAGCKYLTNTKQPCTTRGRSTILFGSDNVQFYFDGAPKERQDGVRYVDVDNRTEIYTGNEKQGAHVFESSNRMYIDTPTQRLFFERTSSTQHSATPLAQQSSIPFGIWKASHCEYYKDGALLPAKRCNLKLEMKLSILPEKFVFEIEGKAPRVVSNPAYKEFPKWVEIQTGSSSDRIHTSEKDFISTFMNTPTPDVSAKVYFTKIESIGTATQSSGALQVPATPATNDSSGFVPVGMQAASGKDLSFLKKALKITDNVKMVVGRADFNGDQQDDYLVVLQSSLYCGSGGCSTFLVLGGKQPTAYQTNLTYIENQFAVSTNMHKGIKNVVYMMDGKPVLGEKRGTPLYGKVLEYEFERAMK